MRVPAIRNQVAGAAAIRDDFSVPVCLPYLSFLWTSPSELSSWHKPGLGGQLPLPVTAGTNFTIYTTQQYGATKYRDGQSGILWRNNANGDTELWNPTSRAASPTRIWAPSTRAGLCKKFSLEMGMGADRVHRPCLSRFDPSAIESRMSVICAKRTPAKRDRLSFDLKARGRFGAGVSGGSRRSGSCADPRDDRVDAANTSISRRLQVFPTFPF
jgi:hypothetical protein